MKMFNKHQTLKAELFGSTVIVTLGLGGEELSLARFKSLVRHLEGNGWTVAPEDQQLLNSLTGESEPRQRCLQLALNI